MTDGPDVYDGTGNDTVTEAGSNTDTASVENPLAGKLTFSLLVPEIEVRMVNASGLGDYELWMFASSATLSSAVGFFVGYMQSGDGDKSLDDSYLVVTIFFCILFTLFTARALYLRHKVWAGSQTYKMRAVDQVDD